MRASFALLLWGFVGLSGGTGFAQDFVFEPALLTPTPSKAFFYTVGDYDLNGTDDVLVSSSASGGTVALFAADGAGVLSEDGELVVDEIPQDIVVGQLDGTGDADLAVLLRDLGVVRIFLAQTGGGYGPFVDLATGSDPNKLGLGDLNADGDLDLLVGRSGGSFLDPGSLEVYLGDGTGDFLFETSEPTAAAPVEILTGDLDADGLLDVVTSSSGAVPLAIGALESFLGDGTGNFSATFSQPGTPSDIALVDVDNDGDLDVAATLINDVVCSPNYGIYLGDGTGQFGSVGIQTIGCFPTSLDSADFDLDGNADLVVSDAFESTIFVLKGDGTGGFAPDTELTLDFAFLGQVGDLNQDGQLDIVSLDGGTDEIAVFLNSTSIVDAFFARGDINQDGVVEISDAISLLTSLFVAPDPIDCEDAADANDDGQVDIADAVEVLGYLFAGGDDLPEPFGVCGTDPTPDALPTCVYAGAVCP